jgi:hypothetical protein
VSLSELYVNGVLPPGPIRSKVDEKVCYQPYSVTLGEIIEVVGGGSEQRAALAESLSGFVNWMPEVMNSGSEIWVRGPLVADLRVTEPEDLDIVIFGTPSIGPNLWPFSVLCAEPVKLHPGRLAVTPIWENGGGFDTDREAVRSSKRCQNENGEQITTGWIQITESEVP